MIIPWKIELNRAVQWYIYGPDYRADSEQGM